MASTRLQVQSELYLRKTLIASGCLAAGESLHVPCVCVRANLIVVAGMWELMACDMSRHAQQCLRCSFRR